MDIEPYVLESSTTDEQFHAIFAHITARLGQGKCAALVIRKGALTTACRPQYANAYTVTREQAVGLIARMAGERDIFVSTTGKLSRELFEIRQGLGQGHARDFLTVGSMGHASMIALGIALAKPERRVWCLDGDGAALMHMGHLGVIAKKAPRNLIHVIMNNGAHETVGGMPVAEGVMRFAPLARDARLPCGVHRRYPARPAGSPGCRPDPAHPEPHRDVLCPGRPGPIWAAPPPRLRKTAMPSWLLFKTPARREPSASPAGEPAPNQKTAGPATPRRRSRYFYALLQ